MSAVTDYQSSLLERFVASFNKLDDMIAFDHDTIASQLAIGHPDQYGYKRWSPRKIETGPAFLESIYSKLPVRFPHLFERLVLSYRWAQVDLESWCLLANPPGHDLTGFYQQISGDNFLWNYLLNAGYIRFALEPGGGYDPVCFEIGSRKKRGDFRIVRIDHEEILCNERLKVVSEVAPSFEDLVVRTIERADSRPSAS